MSFIKKLQNLPEKHKIAIIVVMVVIATAIMGYFWVMDAKNGIAKIADSAKSAQLPNIDLPTIPTDTPTDSPTPTPGIQTADWKTYSSTNYGFTMQYPADWPPPVEDTTKNNIDFNGTLLVTYYKTNKDLPGNSTADFSLSNWLSKNKYSYLYKDTLKNVTIGDNYSAQVMQESYCNGVPFLSNAYFALKPVGSVNSSGIYQIEGPLFECGDTNMSQEYDTTQSIVNQMLSTFKFTN